MAMAVAMERTTLQEKYDALMGKCQQLEKEIRFLKTQCCCPRGIVCEKHKVNTFKPNYTVASQYMEKRKAELAEKNPNKKFIKRMDKEEYANHPIIQKETRQQKHRAEKLQKNRHDPAKLPVHTESYKQHKPKNIYIPVDQDMAHHTISIQDIPDEDDYDDEAEYEQHEDIVEEVQDHPLVSDAYDAYEQDDDTVEEESKEEQVEIEEIKEVEEEIKEEQVEIKEVKEVEEESKDERMTLFNEYLVKSMKELKEICKQKNLKGLYKFTKKTELIEKMIELQLQTNTPMEQQVELNSTDRQYSREELNGMSIKELKTIAKRWKGHSKITKKDPLIQFILERL